jgi:hypothetical protein
MIKIAKTPRQSEITFLDRFRALVVIQTTGRRDAKFWEPFVQEWWDDWRRRKVNRFCLFPVERRL